MNAPENEPAVPDSAAGSHIRPLDGIRGLAILLVLADHLFWSNPHPEGGRLLRLVGELHAAGWVGVDLFFVLSGFLITGILYDTLQDPHFFRNFYARRALRIFPLYYGVLGLLLVVVRLTHGSWSPEAYQLWTYTENLHLRTTAPFLSTSWININHFWSLAVEEQFYLCWPFLVFLLRTRQKILGAALAGALLSLFLRVLLFHTSIVMRNPYVLYSWTPARMDGLLGGAALAMLTRTHWRPAVLAAARPVLVVCVAILAGIWWRNSGFDWQQPLWVAVWGEALLAVLFTALIAACLRGGSRFAGFFSQGWICFFGRYSYGLYLYHYTIASLIPKMHAMLRTRGYSKAIAVALPGMLALLLSVTAAWLSFQLYERRFLQLKRYFHAKRSKPNGMAVRS